MDSFLEYDSIHDDFGPINFVSTANFARALNKLTQSNEAENRQDIVCFVGPGPRAFTNAAFLVGAYMILFLEYKAEDVSKCFEIFDRDFFEDYRDASYSSSEFTISLLNCWRGLEHAKDEGWVSSPSSKSPYRWGMIDAEAYDHYDNPLHADLHEVVPGKLIIFRGPKDLGGLTYKDNLRDGAFISRDFSPEYCADLLKDLGVSTIVRLNRPQYDAAAFVSRGFDHMDLDFEGGSTPPPLAAARFFRAVDGAPGLVAIHGRESLGRAGTLAALHLMRSHGFGAREAMAWLRVMRPGAVLGEQQHYLVHVERTFKYVLAAFASPCADLSSLLRHRSPARPSDGPSRTLRAGERPKH